MSDPAPASGVIRLNLLGATSLNVADGTEATRVLQQPKRFALLVWLVLRTPTGFARRDALLATFWPELDPERARSALRQSVHFLRQQLGADVIANRGDEDLGIRRTSFGCDVWDFERALADGRRQEALAAYRGDLLPGFFLSGTPEFEQWLEIERSRLRERAVALAWDLSSSARAEEDQMALAHRAVALAPDDESGVRRLMELLAHRGERASAFRLYESLEERLRAEDDTAEAATQHLAATLRTGVVSARKGRRRRMLLAAPLPGLSPVRRPWRVLAWMVVGAGLALLATATFVVLSRQTAVVALDSNLVVVAPFDVYSPSHDLWRNGLASILSANLDGAGPLRSVPASTVIRAWTGPMDHTRLGEAAARHGAGLAIGGRVLAEGRDSVRLTAVVLHAGVGNSVELSVRGAADRMDLLSDSLTVRVLRHLSSTQPIAAVRRATIGSPSLVVLKAYLQGEQFYRLSQWDSALAMFRLAADEDSTFAPALRRVANVMSWIGTVYNDSSRIYELRAGRFNRGLAARETLLIQAESLFASLMEGGEPDLDWWRRRRRMYQTLTEARRRYPSDPEIWTSYGEALFHVGGHPTTSLKEMTDVFDEAIELDPAFAPAYIHPVMLTARAGDLRRARVLATAYMREAASGVTREGIGAFLAVTGPSGPVAGYPALGLLDDPSAMFEAWAPLDELADSTATVVMRRLAGGRWTDAPFAVPEFRSAFLFRTMVRRGRLREAFILAAVPSNVAGQEVAAMGVLAMRGLIDTKAAGRWARLGASMELLPLWAARQDTTAILSLAQLVRQSPSASTAYSGAAIAAYLAIARADTAAALRGFEALPDSICPACATERLAHASLLVSTGRLAAAKEMLEPELAPIPQEAVLGSLYWDLLRATVAEQMGARGRATGLYRRVADFLVGADAELTAVRAKATAGLARMQQAPASH